jgi:Tol biopolymer transport system component
VSAPGAQPRVLIANPEFDWIEGLDWAPDGKTVAAQFRRADGISAIGLVNVADGTLRVLHSLDWRWTSKMFYSPDGKYIAYDFPAAETNRNRDVFVLTVDGTKKIEAVVHGANDRAVGWSPDGGLLLFISDRAGSDALWAQPFDGGAAGAPVLLKHDFASDRPKGVTRSGSLYYGIPHVSGFDLQVAAFDFQKERFTAPARSVLKELITTAADFDWSPDGRSIVYVSRRHHRQETLAVHDFSTGALREWQPSLRGMGGPRFAPDGRSVIVRGVDERKHASLGLYRVDTETGNTVLLAAAPGPSQRADSSPDGSKLYFKRFADNRATFVERDLRSGEERVLVERKNLGWVNLSPDGRYITTTGRSGAASPQSILLVDTAGAEPKELMQGSASDALSILMWAPDSRSVFVRKVANGKHEMWRLPVDDGNGRRLDVAIEHIAGPIRVTHGGKQVAFNTRGASKPAELWVLENFLPAPSAKQH